MSEPMRSLLKDEKYCEEEIRRVYEMMSNKETFTFKNIDAARQSLCWMKLYGATNIQASVDACLIEIILREKYFIFYSLQGGKAK
jgi:hypothetical protein